MPWQRGHWVVSFDFLQNPTWVGFRLKKGVVTTLMGLAWPHPLLLARLHRVLLLSLSLCLQQVQRHPGVGGGTDWHGDKTSPSPDVWVLCLVMLYIP